MNTTTAHVLLLSLSALLIGACTAETETTPIAANAPEQNSARNCSFIPGCKHLLEASDGAFSASVMTYDEASGREHRRLTLTYREPIDSQFLLCHRFPNQPNVTAVFVLGAEDARTSVRQPMSVSCPRSHGDNGGATNTATFSIVQDEDPALWDTLFPPQPNGDRWYALQVAATNAEGAWDSGYGQNYRLVLKPR